MLVDGLISEISVSSSLPLLKKGRELLKPRDVMGLDNEFWFKSVLGSWFELLSDRFTYCFFLLAASLACKFSLYLDKSLEIYSSAFSLRFSICYTIFFSSFYKLFYWSPMFNLITFSFFLICCSFLNSFCSIFFGLPSLLARSVCFSVMPPFCVKAMISGRKIVF